MTVSRGLCNSSANIGHSDLRCAAKSAASACAEAVLRPSDEVTQLRVSLSSGQQFRGVGPVVGGVSNRAAAKPATVSR